MPDANQPGLSLVNIAVQRGHARVLESVSLGLEPGEIVAVVGPNGAGKTTLLEAVLGAVPLLHGETRIDGQPVRTFAQRARAYAYLAAEAEPARELRVEHLLALASVASDRGWSAFLAQRLGIQRLRGAVAGQLSRGERRRLLLFEALCARKPFLLLDEPTGVFDPLQLLDIVEVFRAAALRGTGMLVCVHQMSDAEAIAARILILSRGRQVALGTMAALRELADLGASATLQEVFLQLLHTHHAHKESDNARA